MPAQFASPQINGAHFGGRVTLGDNQGHAQRELKA